MPTQLKKVASQLTAHMEQQQQQQERIFLTNLAAQVCSTKLLPSGKLMANLGSTHCSELWPRPGALSHGILLVLHRMQCQVGNRVMSDTQGSKS